MGAREEIERNPPALNDERPIALALMRLQAERMPTKARRRTMRLVSWQLPAAPSRKTPAITRRTGNVFVDLGSAGLSVDLLVAILRAASLMLIRSSGVASGVVASV
jgi:hypothetical protein